MTALKITRNDICYSPILLSDQKPGARLACVLWNEIMTRADWSVIRSVERGKMLTEIGSYEAKTRLAELLRDVSSGKQYVITLRGRAIAELVPPRGARGQDRQQAAENMRRFMFEASHGRAQPSGEQASRASRARAAGPAARDLVGEDNE